MSEKLLVCPSEVLEEHAGEGLQEDPGSDVDEIFADSAFDTASVLEPTSVLSSLCPKVVTGGTTSG